MLRDVTSPVLDRPFADGRLALQVSTEGRAFPFVEFAQALADAGGGEIVNRIGGLGVDEVYWDIRMAGHVLTLHSQHYLGVFLCATDEASEVYLRGLQPKAEAWVMVVREASAKGPSLQVWYPIGEVHEPLLSAWSSRPEDLPIVEGVVFSGRVTAGR